MEIVDIRTVVVGNPWKNWLFVVLETDEGLTGLGEATGGLTTMPISAAVDEIRHTILGLDPRNVRLVRDTLSKAIYLDVNPALTGIELACWDILGKSLGVPVWQLLGGRIRGAVPAYANGWYTGDGSKASFSAQAREVTAMGYRGLKFDPFGDAYGSLSRSALHAALDIVAAVREAVGDDVDLMIEAHDRFHVDTAIQVGQHLERFDVRWYEAPTLSTNPLALSEIARNVRVAVAAGERAMRPDEFPALLAGGVRVAQPEVMNLGLIGMLEVAAIAAGAHVPIAPHNAQSPFCTVVNLHLAAATSNFLVQEHFDAFAAEWVDEVLTGGVVLVDGELEIPTSPGFGVELNEELAAAYPYSERNFMRLFAPGWERRFGDR